VIQETGSDEVGSDEAKEYMKEILIINLTRMGDLLQTTPLMAGFKEKNPDVKITLLVSSRFAEICKGISFIDDLIVLDMHGFRDCLLQKKCGLVENYRSLEALINRINEKGYDLVMNLTHSPVSALITSLVRAKEIRGFSVDREGHRVIRHPWLRYFFNVVPNRDYNPFHLVDMYLKAGNVMPERKGLIFETSGEDDAKAGKLLKSEGVELNDVLFGIHLGASKGDKTWPVASFAALADMIAREFHAKILLFGSPAEEELGRQFIMMAENRPVNFIGRTGLGELSALLKRTEMLIGNDTGPLHLATAAGTKVIDIFTANVHFLETSPYGEGHYVIQADLPCVPCGFDVKCNNMICKDVITPELVFRVIKRVRDGTMKVSEDVSFAPDTVQIYRTYFKKDGMLGFYPVVKKPVKKEILYRILYREIWNLDQEKKNGTGDLEFGRIYEELSSFYLLNAAQELVGTFQKDRRVLEHLTALAAEGMALSGLIAEEAGKEGLNFEELKTLSSRLESVDNEIAMLGHANPCFRPLTVIFAFSREALEGNDLIALSESSGRIHGELLSRGSSLLDMIDNIVLFMESKPHTVQRTKKIHGPECREHYSGYPA
jgi:ADP-heptose:LPS heptosyltransferase